jgi:hypothetical protein
VNFPAPAAVLRHSGPALLLERVEHFDGDTLACVARGSGPWHWPAMLEAAAQGAGLLAGLQAGGPSNRTVIAEYRGIVIHAHEHPGPVRVRARLDRRLLHFWRVRIEAEAMDGQVLLAGLVTLAPGA